MGYEIEEAPLWPPKSKNQARSSLPTPAKASIDAHIQTVCSRLIRELNGRDTKNEACIGCRDTILCVLKVF
jgi:hypothetical protein